MVYTNRVQGRSKISKVEGGGARSLRQVEMLGNSQNNVGGKADLITLCVFLFVLTICQASVAAVSGG